MSAHEHWSDLRRTFSAETYERMLDNHALTDEQRQQIMKMRDRRARMEAETRFTEEQTKAYLRSRSKSSAALLAAREQMDAMRAPRDRATTHDLLHDLEVARSDYDRLSHEKSMSAELERVQQHLAELRAELGVPPPIQDVEEEEEDEEVIAAPPPPIDVIRPQVAGRVSDGPRGLRVLDAGVGGFPELVDSLVDDLVQFGVLRFELGSGSFMREKFVFLQYAGPNAGAVKRGRHVGQAAMVKEAMGGAHASMVFYDRDEMTTDNVLHRLLSIITADDGDFDLEQLRAMIDAQIAQAEAQADTVGDGGRHVLTAAEMRNHNFGAAECIRYVKAPAGPFNWLLLEPDASNLTRESSHATTRSCMTHAIMMLRFNV